MTYSIVARDENTGAMGVATATGLLAVGALVPHAAGGIGAIATQGYSSNPFYGTDGLALLKDGLDAEAMVARVTADDEGRGRRQVIAVDGSGKTAGWTGPDNENEKLHACFPSFAVAGNMLASSQVVDKMVEAYLQTDGMTFAERLLAALETGEQAGGDMRRKQSAALLVSGEEGYASINLRVDDHPDPVRELKRLYGLTEDPALRVFMDRIPTRKDPFRS